MTTSRLALSVFVLAAAAIACGGDDSPRGTSPAAAPGAETPTTADEAVRAPIPEPAPAALPAADAPATAEGETGAAAAPPASPAEAGADGAKTPTLSDLLRVPGAEVPDGDASERTTLDWETPPDPTAEEPPAKKSSRVGIAIDSRDDPVSADERTTRKQTDANVSLDVDETTRVRGGVRVQEEAPGTAPERVPTVGIEKRF